jgi:hypothetical protein
VGGVVEGAAFEVDVAGALQQVAEVDDGPLDPGLFEPLLRQGEREELENVAGGGEVLVEVGGVGGAEEEGDREGAAG